MRTVLLVVAGVGVVAAFREIGAAFLIAFAGIVLALVFEYPVRFVMEGSRLSRGLVATVTVLGTAVGATIFFLLLVGGVRDYLRDLPQTVEDLRTADGPAWLGDSGAAGNVQSGAEQVAVSVDVRSGVVLHVLRHALLPAQGITAVTWLYDGCRSLYNSHLRRLAHA